MVKELLDAGILRTYLDYIKQQTNITENAAKTDENHNDILDTNCVRQRFAGIGGHA